MSGTIVSLPNFERVRKVLLREAVPDRAPLMELWVDPTFKKNYLGHEPRTAADEIDFFTDMGMDYVPYNLDWGKALHALGVDGDPGKFAMSQDIAFNDLSCVEAFPWPKAEDYQLDLLYEIDRQLPQGMKVIVSGGYIYAEAWMLMGFSNFAEATLLTPEIPITIMNRLGKFRYESFLRVMELKNLGALWFDDDIAYGTGTMVSPTFLRENLFPWIGKVGRLCREKGIPFIYHTDGNVTAVLEDIHQAGVNALHPIQPGAMDAVSLKKDWGDRLALVGGMELDIIARGKREDIEDLVRRQLTELKPGGGYAPGTSNTVPAWMPVENYLWFRDCCIKYGVY